MRALRAPIPRGAFTVSLLGIALVATLLLAWQAYSAAASHRAASEAVLHGYASLAAEELIRRGASEVGYQGYYVLTGAIAGSRSDLTRSGDPRIRRVAPLLRRRFTLGSKTRDVVFEGGQDRAAAAWLAEQQAAPRERDPYTVLNGVVDGEARTFVLAHPIGERVVGYEVDNKALGPFFAAAVDEGPLLPASLAHGQVGNEKLALVVRDAQGRELFRRGGGWSGALRAVAPGGDAYGGALLSFSAEVEIDPAAAAALVIGGLPQSRLPQLLALVGLAAALLGATFVQVRRERELERLRAEFVASASHELRTPLAQLRLFAETLRLGRIRSEPERQHALEVIDRESRRLAHLVENLLQFSRSGRAVPAGPEPPPHELGALVLEVVESFRPVAEAAGARIRTKVAPPVFARVDPDAWRQVLLNLLDNAVKYGPPGQEVSVTLQAREGRVRLAVEDEGPGIPPAERERVFSRFERLPREKASTVTGTGLGLAVVRELVSGFGGRAFVEGGRGGGACLVVELQAESPGNS
jgi:signal transduction histidine kinase